MKAVLVQCLLLAALVAASPGQTEMKANPQRPGTAPARKEASAVSPNGKKTLQVRQLTKSRFEFSVSADGNTQFRGSLEFQTTADHDIDCGWESDGRFRILINGVGWRFEWRGGRWQPILEHQNAPLHQPPNVRPMPSPSPDLPSKDLPSPPADPSPGEYLREEQPA